MFSECNKLKEIEGINGFITSNVTNMRIMFNCCYELENLDLSNFDTSKVNDMEKMFNECKKLKYLNIENFSVKTDCNISNIFDSISNECDIIVKDQTLKNSINSNCMIY